MKYTHEKADNQMMVDINHAVTIENYLKVTVGSSDADVLVNLMFHFTSWQFSNLHKLWMLSGEKVNDKLFLFMTWYLSLMEVSLKYSLLYTL